jgi:hypothetical protein
MEKELEELIPFLENNARLELKCVALTHIVSE